MWRHMEVSDQRHITAVLHPGKGTPVPTGKEAGKAPKAVWELWRESPSLPEMKLQSSCAVLPELDGAKIHQKKFKL
jgi:hypothetical protein